MLVTILITWQLGLYIQCLPLDKHVSFVYMMRGSEFTKKNNFRYSEEVHTL